MPTPKQDVSPSEEADRASRYYVSDTSDTYKYMLPADEEERKR